MEISDNKNLLSNLEGPEKSSTDPDAPSHAGQTKTSNPPNKISRRRLLQLGAGAGLAAALTPMPRLITTRAFASEAPTVPKPTRIPKAPNILVLMTDQERHHMHWPQGWAEKNLPSLQRLKRHGLYFNRAYTAASQCSPSRAVMLTSRFAPVNRVTRTFLWPGLQHKDRQPNIGSLLKEKAGYEVIWKGKWHLSYAANAARGNGGEDWTLLDIKMMETNYGWAEWNPPDAGNAIQGFQPTQFGVFNGLATLGGGNPNNDGRYVSGLSPSDQGQTPGVGGQSVLDFLKHRAPNLGKPFCLFVSLVNPHDIGAYPGGWKEAGFKLEDFGDLGVELPLTMPMISRPSRVCGRPRATPTTSSLR